MAELDDVLGRLRGEQVRIRCRPGVSYENPAVGVIERVDERQLLLRVHPTRLDGIPLSDIVAVDILRTAEDG